MFLKSRMSVPETDAQTLEGGIEGAPGAEPDVAQRINNTWRRWRS